MNYNCGGVGNNKISDAVEKRKENKNGISLDEKSTQVKYKK